MLILPAYVAEQGRIKTKFNIKTDADLFIVIRKLALKPKTNTVEPLMQGSHNKS